MNSITITGKLIADPTTRQAAGKLVAQFTVGEYAGKNQDGTYKPAPVWRCEVWGERGNRIIEKARKGTIVTVIGRVKREKYQGKDGAEHDVLGVDVQDYDIPFAPTAPPVPATPPMTDDSSFPFGNEESEI